MFKKTPWLIVIIVILITGIALWQFLSTSKKYDDTVYDFLSCAKAGYPILESYPSQCKTNDGRTFVSEIDKIASKNNLIRVYAPEPGSPINSPIGVSGEARGSWFFEGSFPVELLDGNGKKIGGGIATANGEWMTTDFVDFASQFAFEKPTTPNGTLILRKDNPSGMEELDDALEIPILFETYRSDSKNMKIKLYWLPKDIGLDCSNVVPVERTIDYSLAVARTSLNELLGGPTSEELSRGLSSAINPNVRILGLRIEEDTIFANFSNELEYNVAGSCRVQAIRSQIEQTLLQFKNIKKVVISIEGKTEDILQP